MQRPSIVPDLAVASLAAVVALALGHFIAGPMIQPDEGGYLANAAALAGFDNDLANSYHAGYSILLTPAFWLAGSPEQAWMFIKALNAALFFVTVLALADIAKLTHPEIARRDRLAGVALVSLYPMWVVMTGYALSENAFVPVFLLIFCAYLRCIRDSATWPWLLLGLSAGFLYWIHPKAVPALFAAAGGGWYIARARKTWLPLGLFALVVAVMIVCYRAGLTPWLQEHMTSSGRVGEYHYPSSGKLLEAFLSIPALLNLAAHLGGHLFYLAVGSLGLLLVGALSLVDRLRSGVHGDPLDLLRFRAIAVFLGISFAGTLAVSVLLFTVTTEAVRLDTWMYGRYVEGVIAPVLLFGALATTFRRGLWAVAVAALAAGLLAAEISDYTHTAPFNVASFWQEFFLREQGVWAWLVSGSVLVILASLAPRRAGMVVIGAVFLLCCFLQIRWHAGEAEVASRRTDAADVIRANHPPGTCVGFSDAEIDNSYRHAFWFDFAFALYDYDLRRTGFERWYASCAGPLAAFEKDLDLRGEVVPVAISPLGGPTIWEKGRPRGAAYPISVADRSVGLARLLGHGWYFFEEAHVWSGKRAELRFPVPDDCHIARCDAVLAFAVLGASVQRPVRVVFTAAEPDGPELPWLVATTGNLARVPISLPGRGSFFDVVVEIPEATSPRMLNGSADDRVLGIALRSVELSRSAPPQPASGSR